MTIALSAKKRPSTVNAGALRKAGLIPAVLYGHKIEAQSVSVNEKEFAKVFRVAGGNTVIQLEVEGSARPVVVHSVQKDRMKGTVTHADFYQVNLKEKIAAKVAINFHGDAPAVREKGGVLNKTLSEVELEALPNDMPHSVDVDLSVLQNIGDAVHVRDLTLPRGVESFVDADTVICSVSARTEEKEEPAAVDVSAIKVEGEEKRKENEEE